MPSDMCDASSSINEKHLAIQVKNFLKSGQKSYTTNTVTYKKGTVILEESQQLKVAVALASNGIDVTIVEDPSVILELSKIYGKLFTYVKR